MAVPAVNSVSSFLFRTAVFILLVVGPAALAAVVQACPTEEIRAIILSSMSPDTRAATIGHMPLTDQVAAVANGSPEEQATLLASLQLQPRTAAMAKLPPREREELFVCAPVDCKARLLAAVPLDIREEVPPTCPLID